MIGPARALVVRRAIGLVTVQDLGRPGFMHLGIAPGGPLAPSRFRAANAALGNDPRAAGFEIVGMLEVMAEGAPIRIALDGDTERALAPGETVSVSAEADRRVRYLAVEGGVDVPIVFGGRGTLLVAALGGLEGRVLRRGDRVRVMRASVGHSHARPESESESESERGDALRPIRVVPGPDLEAFDDSAIATLLATTFTVSRETDRVGTRLDGTRIIAWPRLQPPNASRRRSAPMVRGAIQVPPDGRLIVLGPDHPTTGGYPLLAVVAADDVEGVVARSIGASVTFELV